jgi:hypothetical protein
MERSNLNQRDYWNNNRSASIVLLGIAAIGLMYFVRVGYDFVYQQNLNNRLVNLREIIKNENTELENISDLLNDSDYYSIYVREEFQFNGNNVIKIPNN